MPAFLNPLPRGRAADAADVRPLAGRPRCADDGAVARQPGLAGVFRHRAGRHQRRPGPAVRAAVASRAARLAGGRVHGQRLEPQASAPADRDLGDLPAIVAADARAPGPRSRTTACWPAGRGSASTPRWSATSRWRPAGCSIPRSAGPASVRRPRRSCSSRRPAMAPRSGTRRPGPTGTGARFTRSAIARCRTRCSRPSMPPTATLPACAARRSNTPLQALTTLNEPIYLECARALALRTLVEGGSTDGGSPEATRFAAAWHACRREPETRDPARPAATADRSDSRARVPSPGHLAANDPAQPPPAARRRHARPARGLDGRRAGAAESGRDDYERVRNRP